MSSFQEDLAHYKSAVTPLNKLGLEVAKTVYYVSLPQGAAKLHLIKIRVIVLIEWLENLKVWQSETLQPF